MHENWTTCEVVRWLKDERYHLEAVSTPYMPADDWPLDVGYLRREDGTPPDTEVPNLPRFQRGPGKATEALLADVRCGRDCPNPWELGWELGWESATFPRPARPEGLYLPLLRCQCSHQVYGAAVLSGTTVEK